MDPGGEQQVREQQQQDERAAPLGAVQDQRDASCGVGSRGLVEQLPGEGEADLAPVGYASKLPGGVEKTGPKGPFAFLRTMQESEPSRTSSPSRSRLAYSRWADTSSGL